MFTFFKTNKKFDYIGEKVKKVKFKIPPKNKKIKKKKNKKKNKKKKPNWNKRFVWILKRIKSNND